MKTTLNRKFLKSRKQLEIGKKAAKAKVLVNTYMEAQSGLAAKKTQPAIGQPWPEQGGIFMGTVKGIDGESDYHLILGPEYDGTLNWNDAIEWAKKLKVDGHKDFTLPNRREQRFLFCNGHGHFRDEWYWSSEQRAANADFAWSQDFGDGGQFRWHKDTSNRARAVRRLAI